MIETIRDNSKFNILIIDNDEKFNSKLYLKLKVYGYKLTQAFNIKEAFNAIKQLDKSLDLIILNIDFDDNTTVEIFDYIKANSLAKIILLSKEDIGLKREEYFQQGILDYHLIDRKIDHIVDDIIESIDRLITNKKETILIIDDSKFICALIKNILQNRNYNILVAYNSKDGLEILKQTEISLLILDLELPDIHGLKLLDGLRDMYLLNEFIVLVISSNGNPSVVREALKGGATNFIKKPFLYEEFLLKVDLLINASRARKTINDQKRQIENSLRSFKALVNSTINGMFIFKNSICVDCNKEATDLLGIDKKEEVLDKEISEIFKDISFEHKQKLQDDQMDYYFEDKIISTDKIIYEVQIKQKNILIEKELLKIISVMDITDIKRNEKILSQQSKMASMGEMIGNIAHQWRQPLTAISVAAGGIKLNYEFDMEDREETILELDNIVNNTQFLSSTIEDFQNFLKNDRASITYPIKDTIKKTLAIIQANLESYEINVVESYSENIQIHGIQNDLVQVLLNVINNAADVLKHRDLKGKKKNILIDINKLDEDAIIEVYDSAGGIKKDIIDKVFEPYFTTKHQSQGTGLGLYMTHQIIKRMGGEISADNDSFMIEDEEYFGAKFTIKIPISQ